MSQFHLVFLLWDFYYSNKILKRQIQTKKQFGLSDEVLRISQFPSGRYFQSAFWRPGGSGCIYGVEIKMQCVCSDEASSGCLQRATRLNAIYSPPQMELSSSWSRQHRWCWITTRAQHNMKLPFTSCAFNLLTYYNYNPLWVSATI